MNPCATFPPPIMYTNEYREKKIRNDVATIFFFFFIKEQDKILVQDSTLSKLF